MWFDLAIPNFTLSVAIQLRLSRMMRPKRLSSVRVLPSKRNNKIQASVIKANTKTNIEMTNQSKGTKSFAYFCSGCNKPIKRDKYLLKACDKYWHENCLKCDRCDGRLGELGSTLYCKSDMNLCKQDYLELFGETGVCSVCEKLIGASEMVMRARENTYHLECFACQLCNQRFCVGDRFYLCENKVVCQYDYEEHILPIQRSLEQTTDSNTTTYSTDMTANKEATISTSDLETLTPQIEQSFANNQAPVEDLQQTFIHLSPVTKLTGHLEVKDESIEQVEVQEKCNSTSSVNTDPI